MLRILTMAVIGALALGSSAPIIAQSPAIGTLDLRIDGVANARGNVQIAICSQRTFMKSRCEIVRKVPARRGPLSLKVAPVPAGEWAVAVYHDENGNGQLDRNGLGIPVEGGGFSRDARGNYGPPSFAAAAIRIAGATRTTVTLEY